MSEGDKRKLIGLIILALGAILAYLGSATTLNCQRLSGGQVDCRSATAVAWIPIDNREFHEVADADAQYIGSDHGGYYAIYLKSAEGSQPIAPSQPRLLCLRCVSWIDSNKIDTFLEERKPGAIVIQSGLLEELWMFVLFLIVAASWYVIRPPNKAK